MLLKIVILIESRKTFNSSLANGRAYLSVFHSSTIKRIKPFAAPTLVEYKPNVIIIYVGCNVVAKQKMDTADLNKIADDIIDIANLCASYGVKDIIVSSVLPKCNIWLTRIIRELNDQLKTKSQLNNFGFICNDNVPTRDYLWKDGNHFTDKGTNILADFVNFLNYVVLNRNDINNNTIWLRPTDCHLYGNQISDTLSEGSMAVSSNQFKEGEEIKYIEPIKLDKKINGYEHKCSAISSCIVSVLDEIKTKKISRLLISNLNINSLSSTFDQLKVLIQGKIVVLIIIETKLDSNFSPEKFVIRGYSKPYRLDRNQSGGDVNICIRKGIPSKELRFFNISCILKFFNLTKEK